MKKLRKWFELDKSNGKYVFDWSDVTSIIYVVCVGGIIMGFNMTPLFLTGCVIRLAASIPARRINLIIINLAMVILNLFYLFC